MRTTDPMERVIESALIDARMRYTIDHENDHKLDFHLTDYGVAIEVKQMHSDRIAAQMARAPNVIAVQGKDAVHFMAALLRKLA